MAEQKVDTVRYPSLLVRFFLTVLVLGLGLHLWTINSQTLTNNQDVFNGAWSRQFEKSLTQTSPITEKAIGIWGAFEYFVFATGRKGVLIGQNGWLFTDEEFQTTPQFWSEFEKNTLYIAKVGKALQAKNISLLIVPVPAKARVYSENLGRYRVPSDWKPVYSTFIETLKQKNILVVDSLIALKSQKQNGKVFFKTDTHWTPLGARAVATNVQNTLNASNLKLEPTNIQRLEGIQNKHLGDLVKFIPLGGFGSILPELVKMPRVEVNHSSLSILGDAPIDVVLVGTSYSANGVFGFADELKLALGTDLLNLSLEGKGAFESMQTFMASLPKSPPKLVIWEIPERFLPVPR
jgi:alginate O-acetyltransferase complex protein AlgJ